jgi:hypothetical protein
MGCTLGYVGGTPRKGVRACVAVHLLVCGTSQEGRMALHGSPGRTSSTGGVLDEYSRRLFVLRFIAARASAQACPSTLSNYSPEHAEHSQQCSPFGRLPGDVGMLASGHAPTAIRSLSSSGRSDPSRWP